jgi:predicted metal-dependent enzyme (double-stranded beta helix superfamily)
MPRTIFTHPLSRRTALAGIAALAVAAPGSGARAKGTGSMISASFDRHRFVEDCVRANQEREAQAAVREVVARAVSNHKAVLSALGEPREAGLDVLHRSPTLTIFAAKWAPQMSLPPHDHRMWAVIGLYAGREDNIHWRRTPQAVQAHAATALFAGDVAALPADAIHSVTNPLPHFTGGLHIYGGDFFAHPRSQWNPETLAEEPSDGAVIRAMFDRENERLRQCAPPR